MVLLNLSMVPNLFAETIDKNECIFKYSRTYSLEELFKEMYKLSKKFDLDPDLIYSIIYVESKWDPCAVSHKGAIGLMQIMPTTALIFDKNLKTEELFDPIINMEIGILYFKALLSYYEQFHPKAIAIKKALIAYNAGPYAKSIPSESKNYVKKVFKIFYKLKSKEAKR